MIMVVMMMIDYEDDDDHGDSHVNDHGDDDFDGVGSVENRMCLLKMMIYSQLSEDE